MGIFVPKKVKINGAVVMFVQSSLTITMGYGETNVRVQVSGKSTETISSENLDTALSIVSFDVLSSDTGDSTDIKKLIEAWKSKSGTNTIFVEPDGIGIAQNFVGMSLTNDPEINESPDGSISLTFSGQKGNLT